MYSAHTSCGLMMLQQTTSYCLILGLESTDPGSGACGHNCRCGSGFQHSIGPQQLSRTP